MTSETCSLAARASDALLGVGLSLRDAPQSVETSVPLQRRHNANGFWYEFCISPALLLFSHHPGATVPAALQPLNCFSSLTESMFHPVRALAQHVCDVCLLTFGIDDVRCHPVELFPTDIAFIKQRRNLTKLGLDPSYCFDEA